MARALNFRCISAVSTSPTNSPDSSTPPTKFVFPKKDYPKWSTGVSPGEYGGPPITKKLRKYWGGDDPDPLASDDFMWNVEFMGRMKRFIQDPEAPSVAPVKEEPSGFLSLSRVMRLDSLEVDLSKELTSPSQQPVEATQASGRMSQRWKPVPKRREQEKWDSATRAATGGSDVMFQEITRPRGNPKVLAAESMKQYYKLKKKLLVLTLGVGGIGLLSAYVAYSPEIAASYGVGLLGSLAYMRMLGNSVDSMAGGSKGLVKGAAAQPRLLVPVVLVMVYNRWNAILVPDYGFMQLQLIPMLVGFFTYKIATFILAMEEAFSVVGVGEKTRA